MKKLPKYRCHKEIQAGKIESITYLEDYQYRLTFTESGLPSVTVSSAYCAKHQPQVGGYYVLYEDGYESYSPADAFDKGYSRLP